MLTGRQCVFMMCSTFRLDPAFAGCQDLVGLMNLKYPGDSSMAKFLVTWDRIVDALGSQLDSLQREGILFDKIKDSKDLSEDIAHYQRQVVGHPDRSYEFLRNSLSVGACSIGWRVITVLLRPSISII